MTADGGAATLPRMSERRRLSAIMFSDIVGYSALMGDDEQATVALVEEHKALLLPIIEKHRGSVLKFIGDAILSSYDSASDAVVCAAAIQEAVAARNAILPQGALPFQLRIGVHVGDVVEKDGDVFGDGVNIAARIQPLAEPGGVCVSQTVYDLVKAQSELKFAALGKRSLKNIKEKVAIFRLRAPAAKVPSSNRRPAAVGPAPVGVALAVSLLCAGSVWLFRARKAAAADAAAEYVDADPVEPSKDFSILIVPFATADADAAPEGARMQQLVRETLNGALSGSSDVRILSGDKPLRSHDEARAAGERAGAALVIWGEVLQLGAETEIQPYFTAIHGGREVVMDALDANVSEADQLKLRRTKAGEIGNLGLIAAARFFTAHHPQRALDLLARVSPPTPDSDLEKAYLYYRQHKWAEAEGAFKAGIRDFPTYAMLYNGLGNLYRARGRYPEAEAAYKKALAIRRDLPAPHYNLGSIYAFEGKTEQAVEEVERAVDSAPTYAPAHTILGELYQAQGRLDEAAEQFKIGLFRSGNTQYAVVNALFRYLALSQAGRADEARKTLADYVHDRGPIPAAHAWPLPVARYLIGDLSESKLLEFLKSPAASDQMRCAGYYYVGMAHLLAGRAAKGSAQASELAKARELFQSVLGTNVSYFFEYRQAKAKLAALPS